MVSMRLVNTTARTMLVVDDNIESGELSCLLLRHAGFRVLNAASGEEARTVWMNNLSEIRVLLTDCVMADISGVDLAAQFLREKPTLQVLFMSGHGAEVLDAESTTSVKPTLIRKPFRSAELISQVEKAFETAENSNLISPVQTAETIRLR
ncbi:MAG: domain S-box-containing protein [Verrucomicrobiales bacterium]|nr:domain S-box-containing protein [Verrucomicrobiales bacterium]